MLRKKATIPCNGCLPVQPMKQNYFFKHFSVQTQQCNFKNYDFFPTNQNVLHYFHRFFFFFQSYHVTVVLLVQNSSVKPAASVDDRGQILRLNLCNASTSCFTTTWDKISNWLINKDLCRNNIFAHL